MNMPFRRCRIWRSITSVALASSAVVAACSAPPDQHTPSASAGFFILAQAPSATAAPVAPTPSSDRPIGLPRARDYEPNPERRDVDFDFGKAVIRPDDVKILDANAAWLRAHPDSSS